MTALWDRKKDVNGANDFVFSVQCTRINMLCTVVTGATDGLGKEYVLHLAREGLNIVLISRNQDKLSKVARELGRDLR